MDCDYATLALGTLKKEHSERRTLLESEISTESRINHIVLVDEEFTHLTSGTSCEVVAVHLTTGSGDALGRAAPSPNLDGLSFLEMECKPAVAVVLPSGK